MSVKVRPNYYELHITMEARILEQEELFKMLPTYGWKFSRIDGDPILGEGVKCYATLHINVKTDRGTIDARLKSMAAMLRQKGFKVIREKIELVLYDKVSK